MIQIIPEIRKQKFSDRLMSGLQNFSQAASTEIPKFFGEKLLKQKQSEAYKDILGKDISAFPPEIQKIFAEKMMGDKANKPDLSNAAKALDTWESMINKPGVGLLGRFNPSSTARFNRGQFESLEAAVFPLFKSMFPRGMTENEYKSVQDRYIPQVGESIERIKGKIKGLRDLINQEGTSMQASGGKGKTHEMHDEKGNAYDIPEELYEKARAKGLR